MGARADNRRCPVQPRLAACFLDERFVLADSTDAALIATAIVHEATHARLWHYGFRYEEEARQRVEAVCLRREIAFAHKLPDGERIHAWATDTLTLSPSYWTNAAERERHYEGSLQVLHHLGFDWLTRAVVAVFEWRRARNRRAGRTNDGS
jgi:hypothetical protein